ncbi:MAG: oxidoreductase [Betaproteobacteria bacterium]|nr:MAG: oxidoreductase [Betaproteobacteria bacterium]TMH08045.1 MAG: oxidoreductase [Betaproteobacteria bacterium]
MSALLPEDKPRPVAPVRPTRDDCCHGGCDPCVFDLYEDELERYEQALRAWESRRKPSTSEEVT